MRIKPRFSSSTQLAAIFSSMIGVAAVFTIYQVYQIEVAQLSGAFFLKITLVLLLFICMGLFTVGHYVTQRLNVISETAKTIMRTGDISQRIPMDPRSDDLTALSAVLNAMLNEIEHAVQGIRTVTDNIAHDLRHPLTRLRNHLEQARESSDTLDARARSEQFNKLIGECDTLLATFNALLRISNIESGKLHSEFEHVRLQALFADIIDLYEPIAHEKNIRIELQCDNSNIVGDKNLLFQAFTNIVDNAIKYTHRDGTVSIRVHSSDRTTHIEIEDEGPGIHPAHRAQVFQRFYRLDESRNTPGNGLGLSLVRAVVDMHKGVISLNDGTHNGLLVRITF